MKKIFNDLNNTINKKIKKSNIKMLDGILTAIFVIAFFVYIVLKLVFPSMIVGGENNQAQKDYTIKTSESSHPSAGAYKYIFGNEKGDCFKNYPLGAPALKYDIADKTALFCYSKYAVQYNTNTKTPIWESHVLKKSDFVGASYNERTNDFREDKNIEGMKISSKPSDYSRTGYDRGHLAPAADFSYSEKAMSESFIMTNIAPQAPQNNRQIWSQLEQSIRKLLKHKNIQELYVTTGILYYKNSKDKNSTGVMAEFNGIQAPTHFYKIIIEPKTGQSAAYLIPNTNDVGGQPFSNFLISIRELEKYTKIDFHPNLSNKESQAIEVNSGKLDQALAARR